MKTNKRPELILNLIALAGFTREIVSRHVQTKLFEFGYRWSNHMKGTEPKPAHLREEVLRICSPEWKAYELTYDSGPSFSDTPAITFDASQVDLFLARAKDALIESRIINGVIVTITPSKIDLNVTELVAKTTSEAQKIQQELFGSGLGSSPA